jgi:hypothetical protein
VTLPPCNDFFAGVSQPGVLLYRFRYSKKDQPDPFDERDEKHWYRVEGPVEKLISSMSDLSQKIATAAGGERWELIRGGGTVEQFTAEFTRLPFAHMKVELDDKAMQGK